MLKFGRVGEVSEVSEVSKMWTASFKPVRLVLLFMFRVASPKLLFCKPIS